MQAKWKIDINLQNNEFNNWELGLVSLFNGILTFVGYLMPKPSLQNSSNTIKTIAGRIRKFLTFPNGITPKVNILVRLEFELAYFEAEV